jgi:hypothetical protein
MAAIKQAHHPPAPPNQFLRKMGVSHAMGSPVPSTPKTWATSFPARLRSSAARWFPFNSVIPSSPLTPIAAFPISRARSKSESFISPASSCMNSGSRSVPGMRFFRSLTVAFRLGAASPNLPKSFPMNLPTPLPPPSPAMLETVGAALLARPPRPSKTLLPAPLKTPRPMSPAPRSGQRRAAPARGRSPPRRSCGDR